MAVTFATVFARLGRLFDFAVSIRAHQTTLRSEYEDTMSNYSDADRDMVKTITNSIERRIDEAGQIVQDLRSDASDTLIEMVDDDTTVEDFTVEKATRELVRQMVAGSSTVDRPSAGYVTLPTDNKGTAGSINIGNGIMLVSDLMPMQGFAASDSTLFLDWPSIQTETIRAECIRDATKRVVAEGEEVFRVTGQRPVPRLDEDWPKGTGTKGTIKVASARVDGGRTPGANVCTNSDFEDFSSNVASGWTYETGSAGTNFTAAGAGHTGSNALKMTGNALVAHRLTQSLRSTSGSLGQINPDRPYSISVAAKYETAVPGVNLTISVRDSGGTILNNLVTGRQMSLQIASGDFTTSYQIFSATVFSPVSIPKGCYIDIRFSSNVANTSKVYIDDLVIAEMPQLQTGGLAYQMLGGSSRYAVGDQFTASITNNIGASDGAMAREFERFFSIGTEYGLALPSATSPTISDSLIS
jgi:hypothetical protein